MDLEKKFYAKLGALLLFFGILDWLLWPAFLEVIKHYPMGV